MRLALKDSMLRYDLDSMAFLENNEDVAPDVGPFEIWNIETGQRVQADTTAWKPKPFRYLNRLRCTLDDRAIVAALVPAGTSTLYSVAIGKRSAAGSNMSVRAPTQRH